MQSDEMAAAVERLNTGAGIPAVAPSMIAIAYEGLHRLHREKGLGVGVDVGLFAKLDPVNQPPNAEQQVAFMARMGLLNALLELDILDAYMSDESQREKVFAAAASFPCNKSHLGEAMALKRLREAQPDVAEKMREDFRQSGYDPDHPKVGDEFKRWMEEHC